MPTMGIKFGTLYTVDKGLMWDTYEISQATPKTSLLDIPGAPYPLDVTSYFYGDTLTYDMRTIKSVFHIRQSEAEKEALQTEIDETICGKHLRIVLDSEPSKYWMGRTTLEVTYVDFHIYEYKFTSVVEPFRRSDYFGADDWLWDTLSFIDGFIVPDMSYSVSGTKTVTLDAPSTNCYLYADITSSGSMKIVVSGKTFNFSGNSTGNKIPVKVKKSVSITMTGSGTVSFMYKGETL